MAISSDTVIHFVKALLLQEAAAGFARLRRVPSTYTWRCLDHLATLGRSRQERLFDDLAARAPILLGLAPIPPSWQSLEMARFYDGVLQTPSPHVSARLLRGMAAAMRCDGPRGLFANLPEALVQRADAIRPTTASQIRKEVKREFAQHLQATAQNIGGGNWIYQGESRGRPFAVLLDYGGRGDQLRYYVQLADAATGIRTRTLNYEGLLGMGFGQWDFVTADSQSENIQLLRELIEELAALPNRLLACGAA